MKRSLIRGKIRVKFAFNRNTTGSAKTKLAAWETGDGRYNPVGEYSNSCRRGKSVGSP